MNQKEINKLDGASLQRILKQHPDREAVQEACLQILGPEAKDWWENKVTTEFIRIVDWDTGKHVSQFVANGNKYYIRKLEDGLGMKRYTELKKGLAVVGFNATFSELSTSLNEVLMHLNNHSSGDSKKLHLIKAIQGVSNVLKGIQDSDRNYDWAFYVATLFIVRKDENLDEWDEALAMEKIEDWKAAKIHEMDFFLLAMYWGSALNGFFNNMAKQVRRTVRKAGFTAG